MIAHEVKVVTLSLQLNGRLDLLISHDPRELMIEAVGQINPLRPARKGREVLVDFRVHTLLNIPSYRGPLSL